MTETDSSDDSQNLSYEGITDNDLIENIYEWRNENFENIMSFILNCPNIHVFTSCEETFWFQICGQFRICPNIDEMYILCRDLYGKHSNEAFASCSILAALMDVYEKISNTLLKLAAYEERMRHIQYFRNEERKLDEKYPTNQPPTKKQRLNEKDHGANETAKEE